MRRASVVGSLDLAGLAVPFPLHFSDCELDSPVIVEGAQLYELLLTGCPQLPAGWPTVSTIRTDDRAGTASGRCGPRIVGHSDIEVTMTIYAYLSLDDRREALRNLAEALG